MTNVTAEATIAKMKRKINLLMKLSRSKIMKSLPREIKSRVEKLLSQVKPLLSKKTIKENYVTESQL